MRAKTLLKSKGVTEVVDIIKVEGDNKYIATLDNGVKCTAIFNPFVCLFYADDVYGIVKEEEKSD